jgi:hypothetical protein
MKKFVTVTENDTRRKFRIGGYYKINFAFGSDYIKIVADKTHGYLIQKVSLSRCSVPEIRMDCKANMLSPYGKTVKSDQAEYDKAFDQAMALARTLQKPVI